MTCHGDAAESEYTYLLSRIDTVKETSDFLIGLIKYKKKLKKLLVERIDIQKLLIKNLEICKKLNKRYLSIPWTDFYMSNQKIYEEMILSKDIHFLPSNLKFETVDNPKLECAEVVKQAVLEQNSGVFDLTLWKG